MSSAFHKVQVVDESGHKVALDVSSISSLSPGATTAPVDFEFWPEITTGHPVIKISGESFYNPGTILISELGTGNDPLGWQDAFLIRTECSGVAFAHGSANSFMDFGYLDGSGGHMDILSESYITTAVGNYLAISSADTENSIFSDGILSISSSDELRLTATHIQVNGTRVGINQRTTTAGNYTMTTDDFLVAVTNTSAPRTITLPLANGVGASATNIREFCVKDESGGAGSNNITIARSGSNTIDGATSVAIASNYGSVRVYTNGTAWFTR